MLKINVKDIRCQLGMTQKELADELGVSQSYISKIEKEGFDREVQPSLELIEAFGKVFRCCPSLLIEMDCKHCSISIRECDKAECEINTKNKLLKNLTQKKVD